MKSLTKAKMVDWKHIELITGHEAEIHIGIDEKVIMMKKYTQEEREAATRELEETPIEPGE